MDNHLKYKIVMVLEQYKDGIRSIREALINVPDSEGARKQLRNAEFSVIHGIHKIQWIGKEVKAKEVTEDDNPSI